MEFLIAVLVILLFLVIADIVLLHINEPKVALPAVENEELTEFMWRKAEYFSSKEWKLKRDTIKDRDKHTCQLCGSTSDLHVHHMSGYDLIPNEPLDCLITLCNACHKSEHERVGYPKTYEEYMSFNHPIQHLNNIH